MNGLDPQFVQYLLTMFPQLAGNPALQGGAGGGLGLPQQMSQWQSGPQPGGAFAGASGPNDGSMDPQATTPAATPQTGAVGGLGGLGGMSQNQNQYAPANATDFMWLQQNNPGQLWQLSQDEMAKAGQGFDPQKSQWQGWSRQHDQYGKPIDRGIG